VTNAGSYCRQIRESIFQGDAEHPYHLSVGVVPVTSEGLIGVHHLQGPDGDGYEFIHETVHDREPLEDAAERGLWEEAGVHGDVVAFIGSLITGYKRDGRDVEKTTPYFQVWVSSLDMRRPRLDDERQGRPIEWHRAAHLVSAPGLGTEGFLLLRLISA